MMLNQFGPENSNSGFVSGFFENLVSRSGAAAPSRDSSLWFVRHFAGIATVRDSFPLLQSTLRLANALGFAVSDTICNPENIFRASGLPPPPAVMHCVDSLAGFAYARSANPRDDGSVDMYANQEFRDHVVPLDKLQQCWATNEREMLSLFVHPEDAPIMPFESGRFLSQVVGGLSSQANSGALTHQSQKMVRILVDGEYVPCHTMIKACSVDHSIYFGFFWTKVTVSASGDSGQAAASLIDLNHGPSTAGASLSPFAVYPFPSTVPALEAAADCTDPSLISPISDSEFDNLFNAVISW